MSTLTNIGIPILTIADAGNRVHGPTISPFSDESPMSAYGTGTFGVAAGWPSTNLALFFPIEVYESFGTLKAWVCWGTTPGSGNLDIGIYGATGVRLASTGATAGSGTSDLQSATLSYTITTPGMYYMAMACDGTTVTPYRTNTIPAVTLSAYGVKQMASAYPLPANATFADATNAYVPLFGISKRSTL